MNYKAVLVVSYLMVVSCASDEVVPPQIPEEGFEDEAIEEVEATVNEIMMGSYLSALYQGQTCSQDSDCGGSLYMVCKEQMCSHKTIFPLTGIEVLGTVVLTVFMALAVMSGIGGGGIIVPLLMVFYKLSTKGAIAVSGFTILTGSICRYAMTLKQRHPDKDATCVDYGLTNIMLPTVLVGSITGVFFNIVLPDIILQSCLTLLLAYLSIQSGCKARSIYRKETQRIKQQDIISIDRSDHTKMNSEPDLRPSSLPSENRIDVQ